MIKTIGGLFSGVGGLELGLSWAMPSTKHVWMVENDPFCASILRARFLHACIIERDIRDVDTSELSPVDLICGGFPCQDVSAVGSGHGLRGARSGLWSEFLRIAQALQPRWVVVENVMSGAKRWVDACTRQLGEQGYEVLPVPLAAVDTGAPHMRRRVFLVGRLLAGSRDGAAATSDADREPLRLDQQRQSGGRSGFVADADRRRQQSERESAGARFISKAWGEPNGCRRPPQDDQPVAWEPHPWWSSQPRFHGVAHGPSGRMDRARLKAHGNGVVPQNAQIVGEIINLIEEMTNEAEE